LGLTDKASVEVGYIDNTINSAVNSSLNSPLIENNVISNSNNKNNVKSNEQIQSIASSGIISNGHYPFIASSPLVEHSEVDESPYTLQKNVNSEQSIIFSSNTSNNNSLLLNQSLQTLPSNEHDLRMKPYLSNNYNHYH